MAPTLREDIVTLTPALVHAAVRRFTAPDGIFAVSERRVAGVPRSVFTHAAPTVLDSLTSGRGHGGADFLVFGDQRWSFEQFFADVDALAARLQLEGAESFVKSWTELMRRIADKSAALATS